MVPKEPHVIQNSLMDEIGQFKREEQPQKRILREPEIVLSINDLAPQTTAESLKTFFKANGFDLSSANVIKD